MKFPMWFLVGLGAFVVFVLSCELVSRAEVDTAVSTSVTETTASCAATLAACQQQRRVLLESCVADQVSMREIEVCPGFAEFMTACREGE